MGGRAGTAAHGAVRRRTAGASAVGRLPGGGGAPHLRRAGERARPRHAPARRRERRVAGCAGAGGVDRDVRPQVLSRRAHAPAAAGDRRHDARLRRPADGVRAVAGGPRDDDRGGARAVAREHAALHRGPGAAARDHDAPGRRRDPLAPRPHRRAPARGGARGRPREWRGHGRRLPPRRQARGARAARRLPRAARIARGVPGAADRARAESRAPAGLAGGAGDLERRPAHRHALRPGLDRRAAAPLGALRLRHGARRADRRAVRRVVAHRTPVPARRDPAGRGCGRAGRPRDGERGAGAADPAEARGDRDAPVGEPGTLLDARPRGAAAPFPPDRHAGTRGGLRGRLAARGRQRVARARRGLPHPARALAGPPRGAPLARARRLLCGGGADAAPRGVLARRG